MGTETIQETSGHVAGVGHFCRHPRQTAAHALRIKFREVSADIREPENMGPQGDRPLPHQRQAWRERHGAPHCGQILRQRELGPERSLAIAPAWSPSVYRCVRPRWVGGTFGSWHDGGQRNGFVPSMGPKREECNHREQSVFFMVRTGMNHRRRRRRLPRQPRREWFRLRRPIPFPSRRLAPTRRVWPW